MNVEQAEREIGKIILQGLDQYKSVDFNVLTQNGEGEKEMKMAKKIVIDETINKIQEILIRYGGNAPTLLPYLSKFFYEKIR
jgi:hypothetical protein